MNATTKNTIDIMTDCGLLSTNRLDDGYAVEILGYTWRGLTLAQAGKILSSAVRAYKCDNLAACVQKLDAKFAAKRA